jgi:hypothetical protein
MEGVRKRWKDTTLIGSGYVDEEPMWSSRGFAGEKRWEIAHMVELCHSSRTQYRNGLHKCVATEGTAG